MPRTASGCVTWNRKRNCWEARGTFRGKRTPRFYYDDPHSPQGQERARERFLSELERMDREGLEFVTPEKDAVPAGTAERETVEEYAKRWLKARDGRVRSLRDNRSHLKEHVLPELGLLAMSAVKRADVEAFVATLDRKVSNGEIGSKTAKNAWGTCSKLFDDASNAKPATGLRCLETDPCDKVRGPDDDEPDKMLQFLYPDEFTRFLSCDEVPRGWRENAEIAVYLCLRDGEQRSLKWSAVDLEHGLVTISETFDRGKKQDREGTKSGAARLVAIPPPLLPLLEAMHERDGGEGYVCKMPSLRDMARGLRRWRARA